MDLQVRDFGTIGVLMGGSSSERDISFKSGNAIAQALLEEGCQVATIEINSDEESVILNQLEDNQVDVAFIALHGRFGEDGGLQEILDRANICYTGSGTDASCLAFNKIDCQKLFQSNGIKVPHFNVLIKDDPEVRKKCKEIIYPVFVKPAGEGSSIGISYVTREDDLTQALELAWRYGNELLIEEAIEGREMTVGILGNDTLPIVEICPKNGYFDFNAKYKKGQTEYTVPAKLPNGLTESIQKKALQAYQLLGCRHFGRADFMIDRDNQPFILEVNTIPGFTATSLLPMAAGSAGINFNQLCLKITGLAHGEKKKVTNISHSR